MATVTGRAGGGMSGVAGWTRWSLSVQAVYKRGPRSRLRRGNAPLYVRAADIACKCPKLKINKLVSMNSFLIIMTQNSRNMSDL